MKQIVQVTLSEIYGSTQSVSLPVDAKIVSVEGNLLSALGDPSLGTTLRHIVMVRTSDTLISANFTYIGMTTTSAGEAAFVFESPFQF